MKKIIYLTLSTCIVNASNLTVFKERDEGRDILHLVLNSSNDIKCNNKLDHTLEEDIVCTSEGFENNVTISKQFDYFDIDINDNQIKIKPKSNYTMISREGSIYDITKFSGKNSNKVDIIFYKDKLTYLEKKDTTEKLDFKIDFKKNKDMFVEVLNDDLVPLSSTSDASKLDYIKGLYKKKDFISTIKKADREIMKNNIYTSDILLYKIKSIYKLLENKSERTYNYQDIENSCDNYIEQFPSSKHLSEVIYYKIQSLYHQGKYKTASPIVEKLKENFPDDYYAEKAQIIKAKNLSKRKKYRNIAYKILEELLYNTKNINIAEESAYELVSNNLDSKDAKRAKVFLDKILKFNKGYIKKDAKRSFLFAKKFASLDRYPEAVKIVEILLEDSHDEDMLKNLAFWQEKANMKDLAYKNYKRYLKNFPDGKYTSFVKERKDKILLDIRDENTSKEIENIDSVMSKYPNDPIYKKALIQKLKLFIKEGNYRKILDLEDKIQEINATKYIDIATKKIFESYINKNNCKKAVDMVNKYKIVVNKENLYKLSECYYNLARYKESYELTQKYIASQNSEELQKWYILSIKSLVKLKNYGKAIEFFEELQKISKDENFSIELYNDIFESYYSLKYIDKALSIVKIVEQLSPNNPKLIDIYYKLIRYYKSERIDLSVQYYANKLLNLQKKININTYSPSVDIVMIKSLKNLKKYKDALSYFANAYLSKNISDTQKAQLLYLAGEISLKLKKVKQAREFFIKCGTEVKNDMWQKLCSESLNLIEE